MGFIHFGDISTYNNGVLDDSIYSAVSDSFDYSSEYNPFDGSFIYYDEDQTTNTHNVIFNNSGSMTFDKLEVVEYTDTYCSDEKGRYFANKSVANNQTTFSWNFTDTDVNGFSLNVYVVSAASKYTITYSIADSNWADKVVINPLSPIEVEKGSTTTVQVTPRTGYYFSGTDTCTMFIEDQSENVPFTLTSDGKMFLEMGESYSTLTLSLEFTVTQGEPPVTNKRTNFYTVYAPTDENMKKINNTVFIDNNDVINKFISYKKFWCKIPTDGTAKLKAGNYDFNFEAPVVHGNIIDVSCGSVNVEELHHSLLDYSPFSRLTIYLPFIGFMDLDDKMVMGKAVRVNYRVDVLSGRCLSEVYTMIDDSTESCIASYAGTIASDEPLSQGQVNYKGGYELMTSMQLGELTPFILVNTQVPLDSGSVNLDGLPVEEVKRVGDCTGYIKYSFINASGCSGTDAEKTEIETLLKSGINIEVVETPSEDTGNEDDGF
jgi:hypothetical protein